MVQHAYVHVPLKPQGLCPRMTRIIHGASCCVNSLTTASPELQSCVRKDHAYGAVVAVVRWLQVEPAEIWSSDK